MNLWCPDCNGTSFFYNIIGEQNDPENGKIIVDHMKCRKCNKEFDIQWYEYVRTAWVESLPRFRKR